jgi:thiol-disulfide isomerase/thioredoxin
MKPFFFMKATIFSLLLISILLFSCSHKSKKAAPQVPIEQQQTEILQDFSIADDKRDFHNLSEEIAKHDITIIDFWASWCAPCRKEMSTMVGLRQTYTEAQLGIIGISLDKDYDQWTAAYDEMQMQWRQYSELKGWDSHIVQELGVTSIPYTIIVDSCRHILAKGLRSKELEIFIQNIIVQ